MGLGLDENVLTVALRNLKKMRPDDWETLAEALLLTPYVGHGRPGHRGKVFQPMVRSPEGHLIRDEGTWT